MTTSKFVRCTFVLMVSCITMVLLWCTLLRLYPLELSYNAALDRAGGVQLGIPKRIWTFWNNETLPAVVSRCIETWRRCCPDYELTVLTPETLIKSLPNANEIIHLPFANTPQRLADFIRLHVLYLHGGYWLDASIILFDSLDVFGKHQERLQCEFVGYFLEAFTTDPRYPTVENWFFGCVKHSRFVGHWRDEFMRMNLYPSAMAYVDHIRMHNICIRGIPYFTSHYLSMHVAAHVVMQRHAYPMERCYLEPAEKGPLLYLVVNGWNSERAIEWLAHNVQHGTITKPTFVKMRGHDREVLAKNQHALEIITTPP